MTATVGVQRKLIDTNTASYANTVVTCSTYLWDAIDAHFITPNNTELLSSQCETTLGTSEAISVEELVIISYKLDTSFNKLLTGCTSLGIIVAVTILTYIAAFMFGERFSSKRLCTRCANKAL